MEIVNTKSHTDGKMNGSDANCNTVNKHGAETNDEPSLCNGINNLSVSPREDLLSSSLEAEQR